MINTFLFDLDGTLLPMGAEIFEKAYFKGLSKKLSDHFKPEELVKYIWKSTAKMVENTGGLKTNKEVFFEDFISSTGKDIKILSPIFDEYYTKEFKELGTLFKPESYIKMTVDLLLDKGYDIVVATNPIFPMKAIRERIRWTGIDEDCFKYITCYETMHYCKPNIEFYREVLEVLGKSPEECIMVGNDVEEDLAAAEIGIKTFLLEDHIINRKDTKPVCDYKGSYKDLYTLVKDEFVNINM